MLSLELKYPTQTSAFTERFENYLNETIYASIIEKKEADVTLKEIDIFLIEDGHRNSRRP